MRKNHWPALAGLAGTIGIGLGLTGLAHSQLPAAPRPALPKRLAAAAKVEEDDVVKMLNVLGPDILQEIAAGREVTLPRLGTFRIVRVAESRNLVDGRPVVQQATNVIVFAPDPALEQAAAAPGVKPNAEVPAFQYNLFPGQTPGQKVPYGRSPSTRVR